MTNSISTSKGVEINKSKKKPKQQQGMIEKKSSNKIYIIFAI